MMFFAIGLVFRERNQVVISTAQVAGVLAVIAHHEMLFHELVDAVNAGFQGLDQTATTHD